MSTKTKKKTLIKYNLLQTKFRSLALILNHNSDVIRYPKRKQIIHQDDKFIFFISYTQSSKEKSISLEIKNIKSSDYIFGFYTFNDENIIVNKQQLSPKRKKIINNNIDEIMFIIDCLIVEYG